MEKLTAIYKRVENGWWVATCPEIPGAVTQGETLDDARFMLKDAIRELGAARREKAIRAANAERDEGHEMVQEELRL